jgi:hypothetical protein
MGGESCIPNLRLSNCASATKGKLLVVSRRSSGVVQELAEESGVDDLRRRKRVAYIRHVSEQQCVDLLSVPVVHSGGQQRPLYTSALWEPSGECELSVDIVVQFSPGRSRG